MGFRIRKRLMERLTGIAQSSQDVWLCENMLADSARIREPGELRLVDGQDPSDILLKVKEFLQSKNIPVPASMHRPLGARPWSERDG
jgi:hypothetical protein